MDDTYNIKAVVLNRRPIGENDSWVAVYSLESGKLELLARGVKKIKSKLAGHLEPFNLADIMVVRGQRHNYVGTAVSEKCFGGVKSDLTKLAAAGRAAGAVDRLIKPGVADGQVFELLKGYLVSLDLAKKDFEILTWFFIWKLLANLGHKPELSQCLSCGKKIQPGRNRFDLARGGLVCGQCAKAGDDRQLAISDDGIKLLRLALKYDFQQLMKVRAGKKLAEGVAEVVGKFYRYNF